MFTSQNSSPKSSFSVMYMSLPDPIDYKMILIAWWNLLRDKTFFNKKKFTFGDNI